jgi:tRNA U34 5-methylaminomethyl-2-thiouridine-forming methyltransferase MnmC
LYRKDLDETYHSTHGALKEAEHVFINNGLAGLKDLSKIQILEIGFGTGLNALLTQIFALEQGLKISYLGLEAYPLDRTLLGQLNFSKVLQNEKASALFQQLHDAQWNEKVDLSDTFSITKVQQRFEDFLPGSDNFDLIYFDAFGPRAQGEMWLQPLFQKLYDALKNQGLLVTYCAKGSFKRDLKELGFIVESLPGPPGKREMTRALKK